MSPTDTATLSRLSDQLLQLTAEVRLLSSKVSSPTPEEQWLSLDEAYPRLGIKSKRALQRRIESGCIAPDCIRVVPSSTQKTSIYLVNTTLYLSRFAL